MRVDAHIGFKSRNSSSGTSEDYLVVLSCNNDINFLSSFSDPEHEVSQYRFLSVLSHLCDRNGWPILKFIFV